MKPTVNISVAGPGQSELFNVTSNNIGKPMAVVYTEVKSTKHEVKGKPVIHYQKKQCCD